MREREREIYRPRDWGKEIYSEGVREREVKRERDGNQTWIVMLITGGWEKDMRGWEKCCFEAFKVSLAKVSGVSNGSNDHLVGSWGHLDLAGHRFPHSVKSKKNYSCSGILNGAAIIIFSFQSLSWILVKTSIFIICILAGHFYFLSMQTGQWFPYFSTVILRPNHFKGATIWEYCYYKQLKILENVIKIWSSAFSCFQNHFGAKVCNVNIVLDPWHPCS